LNIEKVKNLENVKSNEIINNFLKTNWILSGKLFSGQQKEIINGIRLQNYFDSSIIDTFEM
jgi:hypothetical protein